jgi:hypothetical protein
MVFDAGLAGIAFNACVAGAGVAGRRGDAAMTAWRSWRPCRSRRSLPLAPPGRVASVAGRREHGGHDATTGMTTGWSALATRVEDFDAELFVAAGRRFAVCVCGTGAECVAAWLASR